MEAKIDALQREMHCKLGAIQGEQATARRLLNEIHSELQMQAKVYEPREAHSEHEEVMVRHELGETHCQGQTPAEHPHFAQDSCSAEGLARLEALILSERELDATRSHVLQLATHCLDALRCELATATETVTSDLRDDRGAQLQLQPGAECAQPLPSQLVHHLGSQSMASFLSDHAKNALAAPASSRTPKTPKTAREETEVRDVSCPSLSSREVTEAYMHTQQHGAAQ